MSLEADSSCHTPEARFSLLVRHSDDITSLCPHRSDHETLTLQGTRVYLQTFVWRKVFAKRTPFGNSVRIFRADSHDFEVIDNRSRRR